MDYFDVNLWGIFAVPVGVLVCFGPALILWARMESKPESDESEHEK